jgi:hypothetical protein
MKKLPTAVVALMLGAITLPALAGNNTPGIDKRQSNQERRIDQGIASGELNKRETARLERGQDRVDNLENTAKADGTVTRRERARIHHAQNVESRRIHRQKHDAQTR